MHYLITGHTGFKGAWLSLLLEMQGHSVSGIALNPRKKSLFVQSNLDTIYENDIRLDIRDRQAIQLAIEKIDPEVIIHLAAQPLVLESYRMPVETFEVNVMGTLNILEATRNLSNLAATLVITTDKVYKNHHYLRGYNESDELGGDDPYSASKAAADLASQSWIKSFSNSPMAVARAGNVIGGGDWASDRIIPDLVNAYSKGEIPLLRYPNAIRPWQHVLDCLNGYLRLINEMLNTGIGGEWNFGPNLDEKYSVSDLAIAVSSYYGYFKSPWTFDASTKPHEASYLLLDSTKARTILNWKDNFDFATSVEWTIDWYKNRTPELERTKDQIERYLVFSDGLNSA